MLLISLVYSIKPKLIVKENIYRRRECSSVSSLWGQYVTEVKIRRKI